MTDDRPYFRIQRLEAERDALREALGKVNERVRSWAIAPRPYAPDTLREVRKIARAALAKTEQGRG